MLGNDVHNINVLTVIASESYNSFARGLQSEMAEAVADRPRAVTVDLFKGKVLRDTSGNEQVVDDDLAQAICYDLIINDSTDPFGHTEGLFTKEFYGSCYNALREDGIMVYQHGSPFYDEDEAACRSMHRKVYRSFPVSRVYQAHIPTCPSGYWLFGFASKKYHPIKDFKPKEWNGLKIETWYYTTHLHMGAFMLPKYVEDLLEEEEQ